LKVLRAYDVLEEQEVEGENITSTMNRVETMMSTIIRAFEKQLDNLFSSEALDISTDMVVMEQMLAREGITEDGLREEVEKQETVAAEGATAVSAGDITLEL